MEQITFKLPEDLTISTLAAFKEAALQLLENTEEIVFDDSEVSKIDTVGIQLLLAFIHELNTAKKEFKWQIKSKILKDSIYTLGLEQSEFKSFLP